ncbi:MULTISPECIES: DegT/DnrJ/EryC1/StrS family aminotransferase [unclassified Ensifer]|uniref:DegT/DnrJ/EryC1/StrS family aminotransferase n=1 Tax=unclassified Ensifer TaxID=2633371 RepID=UPI0007157B54|nr:MULTISPECIES: DegT/DnrJ/EryC1/StrS family aminotransferase [unclassified Ensifer]KQX44803.1 aminotransferase DegT [Ensifer sp. Root1298]KQX76645.1 aminotransferase DegT [Ensifer sp. Root1312]KRC17157.1 aminotransferase DegT [Ensifer sp. Root74]KRD62187.1 aminotransferase DegT [Ensifer sp. Root954]
MSVRKISVAAPRLSGNEKRYVNEALDSTWISSKGEFIDRFEEQVAEMAGVEYAIACNNGTTSLHLAMVGLGLQPGDEVIMPALTYIATANCVRYCAATPVFVDNDPRTFNIDPEKLEAAITPRTRGIVVVHLYGQAADMDPILEIAERYGLWVLEDAAEAHGALYKGKRVGGLAACGSFSFFGNKIVTTGEGGAVTTNDSDLAARMRLLRNQGMDPDRRYWHPVIGFNYRMTNVTAAIGVAQMENLERSLAVRKNIGAHYDERLAHLGKLVVRPYVSNECTHAYWMYTVLIGDEARLARNELMRTLEQKGVETRPVFFPLNQMPPYFDERVQVPNAVFCSERGINLPTHEGLSIDDIDYVCDVIVQALT